MGKHGSKATREARPAQMAGPAGSPSRYRVRRRPGARSRATFGLRVNANTWLNQPNRVFHNQSPLQILTQDPAAVEEELVRIDHGMFL